MSMTAQEAIAWVDERLHNTCSQREKLRWLAQAEDMVRALHARCGRNPPTEPVTGDTVLLAQGAFEGLYTHYLEAQLHYASQEYLKFNNAMALYSNLWQEYANFIRRGSPGQGKRRFF